MELESFEMNDLQIETGENRNEKGHKVCMTVQETVAEEHVMGLCLVSINYLDKLSFLCLRPVSDTCCTNNLETAPKSIY